MTPAERLVVESALRLVESNPYNIIQSERTAMDLSDAADALLTERAAAPPETVEITWGQVVEGDQIYRMADGAPAARIGQAGGRWFEVVQAGPLNGTSRVKIFAKGIGKPIQPEAGKAVVVKRGATGDAMDVLGSVIWSGRTVPEHDVKDIEVPK